MIDDKTIKLSACNHLPVQIWPQASQAIMGDIVLLPKFIYDFFFFSISLYIKMDILAWSVFQDPPILYLSCSFLDFELIELSLIKISTSL